MRYRRIWICVMLLPLALLYGIIRYGLYALHSMQDWPNVLAAFVLVVLAVALLRGRIYLALTAVFGYGAGFGLGLLFGRSGVDAGGGAINSLWLVWTVCLLVFAGIGVLAEVLVTQIKKKKVPRGRRYR